MANTADSDANHTAAADRPVTAYVAGLGVVGCAALLLSLPVWESAPTSAILLAVVAVAAGESYRHEYYWGGTRSAFTVVETAVMAALVLLPAPWPAVAASVGVGVYELPQRARPAVRRAFNAAHILLSTAVATAVVYVPPPAGPAVVEDGPGLVNVTVGLLAYTLLELATYVLLVSRRHGWPLRSALRQYGAPDLALTMSLGALGVLAAFLWDVHPVLVLLVGFPLAVLREAFQRTTAATEELEESRARRERLQQLLAAASDGIVLTDPQGHVTTWNHAAEQLTGLPAVRAMGRDVDAAVTEVTSRRLVVDDEHADLVVPDPRGEDDRVLRCSDTWLHDETGVPLGRVLLFTDLTRERRLEQLKEDLLARVSHELRTPLTPILGFTETVQRMLAAPGGPPDTVQLQQIGQLLSRVSGHAYRLQGLVDDLLRASDGFNLTVHRQIHPAAAVVEVVASAAQAVPAERGHPVEVELGATRGELRTVSADLTGVRAVLDELIENAVRHTPAGTPVTVAARLFVTGLAVEVRDAGPGIPTAEQAAVFERFHRLGGSLRQTTGGLGLGLFLARRIAAGFDAQLTLVPRAQQGTGTIFRLLLPWRS